MNFINDKDLFLLEQIVRKNFSAKYKDSVIGIFWTVLKPLLIMTMLTIVFSTIFGNRVGNYPVYLLSGRAVLVLFNSSVGGSMGAILGNKNIFLKTSAPKYIFVFAGIISELINFIIVFFILILVMIATNATFYPTMFLSFIPIVGLIIMETGLALMLSILCVYYTDVRHLWSVFSLLLLYSSAIFYPMDLVPEPYHSIFILNPLYWAISQFRNLVVYGVMPDILNMINLYLIAAMILIIGVLVFKKYENKVSMKF